MEFSDLCDAKSYLEMHIGARPKIQKTLKDAVNINIVVSDYNPENLLQALERMGFEGNMIRYHNTFDANNYCKIEANKIIISGKYNLDLLGRDYDFSGKEAYSNHNRGP